MRSPLSALLLSPLLLAGCSHDSGLAGDWVAAFYRTTGTDTVPDTGADSPDTGSTDTGSTDTGSADTGSADTGSADTGSADTGAPREVLPACEGDVGGENFRGFVRIDQTNPLQGEHLTLFPDDPAAPRPEAANGQIPSSSMGGLVTGQWTDGQLRMDLVPDLDHPFASEADREAWRDHHLQLTSTTWGSRCWTAAWAWVAPDGTVDPDQQGVVFMRRQ